MTRGEINLKDQVKASYAIQLSVTEWLFKILSSQWIYGDLKNIRDDELFKVCAREFKVTIYQIKFSITGCDSQPLLFAC